MLTQRQKLILNAIVNDYILSAEPVGSRSISKRPEMKYSPATIRNEMSDLEEMGFLEQPHTSAGRIPSHKGYRYFVDHLVRPGRLNHEDLKKVKMFFAKKIYETEEVVQQVANILSNLTRYTSFVLEPEIFNATLKHLQLVPLNDETAVAIIVTNTGHVENKTVSIPKDLPMNEIERFVNFLNAKLVGVPLIRFRSTLYNEIDTELNRHVQHYQELIRLLEHVIHREHEDKLYITGAANMLAQPEFQDVEKAKVLFDLFEETKTIAKVFASREEGLQIRIGAENDLKEMNHCSLITATYSIEGQSLGTIGIIGPTRMEYGKVMDLMDYLSKDLALLLSRWYK